MSRNHATRDCHRGITFSEPIAIVGDVYLGGQLTTRTGGDRIVHSTSFRNASHRIFNLESPITDKGDPASKGVLSVDSSAHIALEELLPSAVSLANNHIHDMGSSGISDTLHHLETLGIGHTGAGTNAQEAARPYWISETLCMLAFCQLDSPTLRLVQPATANTAGMNPLTLQNVERALSLLPENARAIVYFHWGEEHLFLPAPTQIRMARALLAHPKVALIIGSHAHRAQGYIEHQGKRAYFCIGNFLFPNFVILPPAIAASDCSHANLPVTRRYHPVRRPTRKKWRLVNRLSLLVSYDAKTGDTRHIPHCQLDDEPKVQELRTPARQLFAAWVWLLGAPLRLPAPIYGAIYRVHVQHTRFGWRLGVLLFMTRQHGLRWLIGRIRSRLTRSSQ